MAVPPPPGARRKGMRWCAAHAKGRAGLADVRSKKCEDCEAKEPSYGLAGADGKGKKRWCAGRARGGRRTRACGLEQSPRTGAACV